MESCHVRSTFDLVRHPYEELILATCSTVAELPSYGANHTIHALKISFGNWLLLLDLDFHGTTFVNFVNYLYPPWCKGCFIHE
jgi:hypothetical protein